MSTCTDQGYSNISLAVMQASRRRRRSPAARTTRTRNDDRRSRRTTRSVALRDELERSPRSIWRTTLDGPSRDRRCPTRSPRDGASRDTMHLETVCTRPSISWTTLGAADLFWQRDVSRVWTRRVTSRLVRATDRSLRQGGRFEVEERSARSCSTSVERKQDEADWVSGEILELERKVEERQNEWEIERDAGRDRDPGLDHALGARWRGRSSASGRPSRSVAAGRVSLLGLLLPPDRSADSRSLGGPGRAGSSHAADPGRTRPDPAGRADPTMPEVAPFPRIDPGARVAPSEERGAGRRRTAPSPAPAATSESGRPRRARAGHRDERSARLQRSALRASPTWPYAADRLGTNARITDDGTLGRPTSRRARWSRHSAPRVRAAASTWPN